MAVSSEMRSHRLALITAAAAVALFLYVGTFSYWWIRSPSKTGIDNGKRVHVVDFQFNAISSSTELAWSPAFWFMEGICGYKPIGLVAMGDESILVFMKTID